LSGIYSRRQEAGGKSLPELNFSDLGCPNQLVFCSNTNSPSKSNRWGRIAKLLKTALSKKVTGDRKRKITQWTEKAFR
jgi:hypothetical protein